MESNNANDSFFLHLLSEGEISVTPDGNVIGKHGRSIGFDHVTGYLRIGQLDQTGKRRYLYAHRLVYQALVGEIPDGFQINHKDGNKNNNHPGNLELATASENIQHAHDTGLATVDQGSRHANAKLSDEQVNEIRADYIPRIVTMRHLSERYNVSTAVIYRIIHTESYI